MKNHGFSGCYMALPVCAALLLPGIHAAHAQDRYPSKPIRLVVAFAPGGITDLVARIFGEKLSARLGQTVIVDNKGGAGGELGAKIVATSAPDGYTLLVTTTALTVRAAANPTMVDPRTQLVPVAMLASSPTVLATKAPSSAKTLKALVEGLKGGAVSYASSGVGTVEHLTAAYLLQGIPGVNATHVPFKSGGEALTAVIGGHVLLSATPIGSAASFARDGQIQLLGVASHKRMENMPDVPTFGETGLADIDNSSWVSIFGPSGLPAAVANRVNEEVNNIVREPAIQEKLAKMGFVLREMTRQEFKDQVNGEVGKWTKIIEATGVELN